MGKVENTPPLGQTQDARDGGAAQGTEAPCLVFQYNGGSGVVGNPLCRVKTQDGGL